jgi:hypothetical protein
MAYSIVLFCAERITMPDDKKKPFGTFDWYISIFVIFLIAGWLIFFIYGITMSMQNDTNDISQYHNLGDTIGGISAPLVGIFSAVLVYITIKQQIRANEFVIEFRRDDIKYRKDDLISQDLKDLLEKLERRYTSFMSLFEYKSDSVFRMISSMDIMCKVNRFYANDKSDDLENWQGITAYNASENHSYVLSFQEHFGEMALTWSTAVAIGLKLLTLWENQKATGPEEYLITYSLDFIALFQHRMKAINDEIQKIGPVQLTNKSLERNVTDCFVMATNLELLLTDIGRLNASTRR